MKIMQKVIIYIIIFILYTANNCIYSQSTFETYISDNFEQLLGNKIFELETGNYILLTLCRDNDTIFTTIYLLSQDGEILKSSKFYNYHFFNIIIKPTIYYLTGVYELDEEKKIAFINIDYNFNIIKEMKFNVPKPEFSDFFNISNPSIEMNDTLYTIFNGYSMKGHYSFYLKTYSCDSISYGDFCGGTAKALEITTITDSTFSIIGVNIPTSEQNYYSQVGLFDNNFKLLNSFNIKVENYGLMFPCSFEKDNEFYYVSGSYKKYGEVRDLVVAKLNFEGNIHSFIRIGNIELREHAAELNSLSLKNEHLFLCGTSGYDQYLMNMPNKLLVAKFDTDLNLIWEKYIGNKGTLLAMDSYACSDGGVVLISSNINPAISNNIATYVIKLNANGELNSTTSNEISIISDVVVYPNPGYSELSVRKAAQHKQLKFCLYNAAGVLVLEETLQNNVTSFNTESLPAGTYFYKITGENNFQESGTWIKL